VDHKTAPGNMRSAFPRNRSSGQRNASRKKKENPLPRRGELPFLDTDTSGKNAGGIDIIRSRRFLGQDTKLSGGIQESKLGVVAGKGGRWEGGRQMNREMTRTELTPHARREKGGGGPSE